jgi:hypothetical protein
MRAWRNGRNAKDLGTLRQENTTLMSLFGRDSGGGWLAELECARQAKVFHVQSINLR